MSIEVIGVNAEHVVKKQITCCCCCGAVLEYSVSDIENEETPNSCGFNDTTFFIRCPKCSSKVVTSRMKETASGLFIV